jgi:hypothetical protein
MHKKIEEVSMFRSIGILQATMSARTRYEFSHSLAWACDFQVGQEIDSKEREEAISEELFERRG